MKSLTYNDEELLAHMLNLSLELYIISRIPLLTI